MRTDIALRSLWRPLAVAALVVTCDIHVSQFASTWQEDAVVGAGFLALAAVCAAGAAILAVRDVPVIWFLMAVACAAATAGYLVSRSIGLPGMPDDVGNWGEPAGIAAVVSQLLVVAAAATTGAIRPGTWAVRAFLNRLAGQAG